MRSMKDTQILKVLVQLVEYYCERIMRNGVGCKSCPFHGDRDGGICKIKIMSWEN